jgi:hypothetical protein
MRKDIQAINEAFSKVHKEQSDNTDMEAAPTSDRPGRSSTKFKIQRTNYDQIFYNIWEDIVDRLSDDELKATQHMITHHDELNKLIDEEYRYRFLSTIE